MPSQETMTTELEAVNEMLACVGEAPINTLTGDFPAAIQIAIDKLRSTSRAFQMMGWNFNTEEDWELSRDLDGFVNVPNNTMDVDLTVEDWRVEVVQRGTRLYDKKNHTYIFDFNPKVTLKLFLPWTELNEPTRNYIKIMAARIYQDQTVGSQEHHGFTEKDEMKAWMAFNQSDAENEDATIFDSWDVGSIVRRKRPLLTQF
jgi:Autographiviridae tail tubular protein Gp11